MCEISNITYISYWFTCKLSLGFGIKLLAESCSWPPLPYLFFTPPAIPSANTPCDCKKQTCVTHSELLFRAWQIQLPCHWGNLYCHCGLYCFLCVALSISSIHTYINTCRILKFTLYISTSVTQITASPNGKTRELSLTCYLLIYLLINLLTYGSFNDAESTSDYITE